MILQPGDILDRYVVDAFVGQGGLAEVYAVRHRVLDTRHALKVLRHATAEQVERLVREGRAQAHIDHPNVVPVRDVLEVAGAPALLMPLVDGPTLRDVVRGHELRPAEAAALLRDIVAGVRHVHDRGLIHRDLKPGNVLIEVRGRMLVPRVADFGLVKDVGGAKDTVVGGFMGTPAYASPEQLQARGELDARTDVWSLGVMLYEMLVGDLPFSDMDLLALSRGDAPSRPPVDPLALDEGWGELLHALLAPEPADRLASCAALDDALDALGVPAAGASAWLAMDAPLASAVLELRRPLGRSARASGPSTQAGQVPALSSSALQRASIDAVDTVTEPGAQNNVARPLDAHVGRDDDIALVEGLLDDGASLVTVTGPAGAGKTRLATEVILRTASLRAGGAWLAALDGTTDADTICSVVARALGLQGAQANTTAAVGRELARRRDVLLVLDNAEHVLREVSERVREWTNAAPSAQFVVTSRMPLEIDGERVVRLAPLSLPTGDDLGDAARLFLDRARRVDARFALQDGDEVHLRAIVAELDGLPLAIELAAARVRLMPLKAIRDRLDRRFALLGAARSRDSSSRSATLRGAIDGSWDLLSGWEQDALAQLSVFAAPFALEDAESVVDLSPWPDAPLAMDAVANLVDHSLVQVQHRRSGEDTPRFRLLVSVREYAREKLMQPGAIEGPGAASGPAAARAVERRHGAHFARLAPALATRERWSRTPEEIDALTHGIDDLVAACERALARVDSDIAARTALGVAQYCTMHGPVTLALGLLERVLIHDDLSADLRLRVLNEVGAMHLFLESAETPRAFRAVLEMARQSGDEAAASRALRGLAVTALERGDLAEAAALLEAAADVYGGAPSEAERAQLAFVTALLRIQQVRNDEADSLLTEAAAWADAHGDTHFRGVIASWRHVLCMKQGRGVESRHELERALEMAISEGHAVNHARYLRSLALLDRLQYDPAAAVARMHEAMLIQEMLAPGPMPAYTLHLAMAHLELGQVREARAAFEERPLGPVDDQNAAWMARALAGRANVAAHEGDRERFEADLLAARAAASRTGIRAVDAQIAAYHGVGALALGDVAAAAAQLEIAQRVASELGIHPGSVEGHEIGWLAGALERGDDDDNEADASESPDPS